jgi:hypothetical protein
VIIEPVDLVEPVPGSRTVNTPAVRRSGKKTILPMAVPVEARETRAAIRAPSAIIAAIPSTNPSTTMATLFGTTTFNRNDVAMTASSAPARAIVTLMMKWRRTLTVGASAWRRSAGVDEKHLRGCGRPWSQAA